MSTRNQQRTRLNISIDQVFDVLRHEFDFGEEEVNKIKDEVLKSTYCISPAKLVVLEKGIDDVLLQQVETSVELADYPNHYLAVYIHPKDKLILLALAGFINNELKDMSLFSENCFSNRSDRSLGDFNNTIVGGGQVENLILVDLSGSPYGLSKDRLYRKMEAVLHDKYLLNLLSSFLTLPVLDKTGREVTTLWSDKKGIPALPAFEFVTQILLNYYFDDLDRAFPVKLPKVKYARFDCEVVISIFNKPDFDVKTFLNLINLLELVAKVTIIEPGGFPIPFIGGSLFVNKEGDVQIMEGSPG